MISHNGQPVMKRPIFRSFSIRFRKASLLVMHSDGLSTSWNLAAYPGLRLRHPAVIAGTLYRDAARQRDELWWSWPRMAISL